MLRNFEMSQEELMFNFNMEIALLSLLVVIHDDVN